MDNGRNFIIERLKSKKVTIDEFNFDKLSAPPLAAFFAPQDIWELNGIAKSIRLSGKLQEKLRLIDNICKRRGLVKFGSGTNRVIYRHPEFNQFVFKIAYDNVALMDNFNEFRNQYLLKPFVAKTFEVSPCGTVAISDRVKPITSREEFISIADDVFTLLNEFIIGKYIMADIGSQFYMNYGLREFNSFGPVLLDYSFLYELDENKIYCNKPDPTSPTGLCEGEIGYDDGFNHLYCSKCGAKYKAVELKKKIKDNEIIVQRQGEVKMKINLKGGSTNANRTIETETNNNDNFLNTMESIIKKPRNDKPIKTTNKLVVSLGKTVAEEPKLGLKIKTNTQAIEETVVNETDDFSVNGVKVVASSDNNKELAEVRDELGFEKVEVIEDPSVPTKIDIDKFIDSLPDNETEEDENLESPISFDETLVNNHEIETPSKSPVEVIDDAVQTIIESLQNISIDAVKDDAINRMIDKIVNVIPANGKAFKNVIEIAVSIFDNAEDDDYLDVVHSEKFIKFIQRVFDPTIVTSDTERYGNDLIINQYIDMNYAYDNSDKAFSTLVGEVRIEDAFAEDTENESVPENEETNTYNGIEFTSGAVINAQELFTGAGNREIIVAIDENGNYITSKEGNIIAIDTINDCEVSTVDIVSKEWIKSVNEMISDIPENTISEDTIGVSQVTEE